ncbi:MAG: HEAT repeat domain-containing protein, partial [Planctomycetota bacterium]|nr:HEAT repeat domain-containing protein [Planctomycetota bacterium]
LLRDIPPGARSPQAGLASLEVREGFTVELMASEPLVRDPVAFDWDGEGRLWVAEMIDYPLGLDGEKKPGGRIVVLSDEDGDQRYDRSTVFLDELPFPTGVRPWRRGALVTTIPRIIYAEDRDGDGRADVTKTLFEGFGHGNEQHLLNGFAWGLDNWLHCANGDSGGVVGGLNLSGRDFRIRPDEGRIELVSGGTQFGRCRDDWGNWFGCSNPRPMFHFVLGDRYLRRNAFLAAPRPQRNVVPAAGPVHPSSRTLPRFNDLHMANRFTSACGLTIYRDELFGADFAGNAFVSEPAHNLVHRIVLEARGVTFDGRRAAGEEKSEFLSSTDNWFRPTSLRVGPDGALWLADMYREVIEHPQYFFTGNFKAFDVRAGSERGRIYRVFPRRRKPRRIPKLAGRGSEALVDSLASPGGWERDFAQQLLVGRRDGTAVPRLERLAIHGEKAVGRLHALCTLDGLGKLSVPLLEKALEDRHGGVRRHAVRLAEGFLEDAEALGNALLARLDDPDPHVELQLACTLGEWTSERAGHALGALAWKRRDDPYVRAAALSSALPHLESVVDVVLGKLQAAGPEGSTELAETLLPMAVAGAGDRPALVERIVGALASTPGERYAAWQLRTLQGALDSLASGKDRTALDALRKRHGPELDRVLRRAREVLESVEEDEALRVAAARLLGRSALVRGRGERAVVAEDLRALGEVLSARHSTTLQRAAVEAIGRMRLPEAADGLLAAWSASSPELKGRILDALLGRDEWLPRVIDALSRGTIRPGEIDASRRRRLTEHEDLGKRAREVLRATTSPDRRQVLERFRDVASLTGSPERGLAHFEAKCSPCHRLAGRGFAVASDLAALTDKSTAALLVAIIDPSRNVESKYLQYSAVTRDGRVLSGILREEAGASVTLLAQEGKEHVLLRRDIVRFESSGTSLMPEGLEEGLTPQGMADLIAAISEAYPPLKKFAGNEPRVVRPYPDGRLELTAENCEIYGASVIFEAKYRNLGYWQSVDDQAVWRIDLPRGGEYDVTLQFACADSEAGGEFLVHSAGGQLTGRVRGTGDWDTYRRRQIGTLSLGAGPEKLVFRSRGAFNGFLIDLRGLILKPKGDANR